MEVFGILSAIFYNVSGLLAVIRVVKQGHADNMLTSYVFPWFGGSLTGLIYAASLKDWPMIINFGLGVLFGTIIIKYKLWRADKNPPAKD